MCTATKAAKHYRSVMPLLIVDNMCFYVRILWLILGILYKIVRQYRYEE
jgi:hypothetical protein